MVPDDSTAANREADPAVIQVTDAARRLVLEVRAGEDDADTLGLWIEVSGVSGGNYTYDMYFQAIADASPGDRLAVTDGLPVVIPEASVDRLRNATLDVSGPDSEAGMVIINPNAPPVRSSPPMRDLPSGDLSGDVAQRVLAVLEQQVNPSIAMHGGRANLVAVEEGVVYLELSGGCQGCGLAKVTLSQGIEVALTEAVPEVVSVVDVTDHASGTDPFFEAAKK